MSDPHRRSNDDLVQHIQRLEKEKEELERKNRERQLLEEKLRALQGSVTSLKSGHASPGIPHRPHFPANPRVGFPCENDSQEQEDSNELDKSDSQRAPTRHQEYSSSNASRTQKSRETDSASDSSLEEEREDVMTERHKHMIQVNRDILVDNMLSDDIFNDLISKKIFTQADVSRIKEKNVREAINEELLAVLCRRSDRAFRVFVESLRKTLQGHLADKIDPPSPSSSARKKKRKRQFGQVNVQVDCVEAEALSPPRSARGSGRAVGARRNRASPEADAVPMAKCLCRQVEDEILRMAKEAYGKLRRKDATPMSFQQFHRESQQTNAVVKESMEIAQSLKMLCQHGEITNVSEGSIVFTVRCHSASSARRLWEEYAAGRLLQCFQTDFLTHYVKKKFRLRKIRLKVTISKQEIVSCIRELSAEHVVVTRSLDRKIFCKSSWSPEAENCSGVVTFHTTSCHLVDIQPSHRPLPRRVFQEIRDNRPQPYRPLLKSSSGPSQRKNTLHAPVLPNKMDSPPLYNLRLRPLVSYR